ncbi:MAG: hypothetical protein Q8O37_09690 [Sulfuricellaceae bacterium]|nr:hypothetical protein [Sulfuricellaceae bacterium]
MRRLFWAGILLMGLPLAVYLTWEQLEPLVDISGSDRVLQKQIAVSDPSVAYVLGKDQWTEFNIPNGTPSLRVVTNATLPSDAEVNTAVGWPYTLQYEFLDSSGNVLLQRDYAYRAGLRQYQDAATGDRFSASFFLDPNLMPTDGHIVVLNLANLPQASHMRVKIHQSDPKIRDVIFRVYMEETLPDFRIAHRWLRLSDEQKIGLAKGNVYSQDLLAENEIRNLLRGREQPLGPTGIAGSSYFSRTLYVMREYKGREVAEPVPPAGVFVDERTHGVIPLPEAGGKIRLNFLPLSQEKAPVLGSTIQVRWFGRLLAERSQSNVIWRGEGTVLETNWKGGILEVSASGGVAVRAFLGLSNGEEQEITPQAVYLRTFTAQPENPLEFTVDHAGDDPTPFRMDIRQARLPGEAAEDNPAWVSYQLLNRHGHIVREGSILASPPVSSYDRLQSDALSMRVTDPSSYYFSLPAEVTSIRLSSDRPVLLAGYTRPWGLVRESRVPEDAYMAEDTLERQVAWFPLKPRDFQALVMSNRSILLATQFRPPVDNPDMLAGRYQWQDFHPQGAWLGRTLFTPVEEVGPLREDTLPATYQPIVAGQAVLLTLKAPRGVENVRPSLAYFRQSSAPFDVKVFLDEQLHYQGRVAGADGEIELPALRAGRHRVRIEGEAGVAFYLNHTAPRDGSLLKRLANRFENGSLRFEYEHGSSCEETLGMRLYTPQGQTGRSVLSVWLEAPRDRIVGPMTAWSFTRRRFDVRPEMQAGSRVAANRRNASDQGQAFFIPLAQDLPSGKYPLHVKLESGPGAYLLLSRIVPGLAAERKLVFEQELRHVQIQE